MNIISLNSRVAIAFLTLILLSLSTLIPSASIVEAQSDDRSLKINQTVKELPVRSKRYALVIGVDDYQDQQITRLEGAANDAKVLAESLIRYAGFPSDQVILLATDQPIERKPTRGNILRRLSNLRGAVPKDGLLLVSFAGHGMVRGERAFLLPSDAQVSGDITLLEDTAINVESMRERIQQTEVKQVVMILDACRNDPGGRADSVNPLTEAYTQGFNFDVRNRDVEAFVTLYATEVGNRAYEYTEQKHGYFTWALIEGLKGGAANERGEITLAGLVKYLQEQVPKRIGLDLGQDKKQRPWAEIQGYKADELVIAVTNRRSAATDPGVTDSTRQEHEPEVYTEVVNRVGIEMVRIPAGKFLRGSPANEPGRRTDEGPQHEVTISQPFYMGKYEVTQAQWRAVSLLPKVKMNLTSDPSKFQGDDLPVEQVGWDVISEFCARLSKATGKTYRLPTEAEWEYACRAGTTGPYAGDLNAMAWYSGNSGGKSHPVGHKQPNGFGLFDMHGNVWEWCSDSYSEKYYFSSSIVDPAGPESGLGRIVRGCGWKNPAAGCRSASRGWTLPIIGNPDIGFRLVRTY